MIAVGDALKKLAAAGLTDAERYAVIACYHEGNPTGVVAAWLGVNRETVSRRIRRASDKLVGAGLPRPRPYGRGSRRIAGELSGPGEVKSYAPNVGRTVALRSQGREARESDAAKAARLERRAFYSSRAWRKLARLYLARHPLCNWCGRFADTVAHVKPRLEYPDLAFDWDNLRSACRACHSEHGRKAKTDRGG